MTGRCWDHSLNIILSGTTEIEKRIWENDTSRNGGTRFHYGRIVIINFKAHNYVMATKPRRMSLTGHVMA
jgi:hypothetical protein